MRFTSTASVLMASLLVKDVTAAVHRGHRNFHKREIVDVTVTVDEVDVITVTNWVTVEWQDPATAAAVATVTIEEAVQQATSEAPVVAAPAPTTVAPAPVVISTLAAVVSSVAPVVAPIIAQEVKTTAPAVVPAAAPTTMATVVKSTAAAVSSAAPVAASGGKRGLPYNTASLLTNFIGSSQISWAYNWASHNDGLDALNTKFEFVPMLWGTGANFVNRWTKDADAALAAGTTHLFSFNEPDHPEQANLPVASAAAGYKQYMMPYAGKAKLGAPAVTNGAKRPDGGIMGLAYMESFIAACTGCQIDFVNVHWYDSASNIDYFKSFIKEAYAKGGNRPLWLTEFGASGSDAQVVTFLQTVLPWLDSLGYVERYSYFFAATGNGYLLSSASQLSSIGNTYKTFTS